MALGLVQLNCRHFAYEVHQAKLTVRSIRSSGCTIS